MKTKIYNTKLNSPNVFYKLKMHFSAALLF